MEQKLFEPTFLNIEFYFNQVLEFFSTINEKIVSLSDGTYFIPHLKFTLSILTIFFITGIIYCYVRIYEIRKEEDKKYKFAEPEPQSGGIARERWNLVQKHITSTNENDWKLAIIEADSILDDLVKKMGYDGESLGEKLKAADVSDFRNIQNAWEAHKVRNRIAHDGSTFEITHREAKRVLGLYEDVFNEFGYI